MLDFHAAEPLTLNPGLADASVRSFGAVASRYQICYGFGLDTLRSVARRVLSSRPILLQVTELPTTLSPLHRFILVSMDLVLAGTLPVARRLRDVGLAEERIILLGTPSDWASFSRNVRVPANDRVTRLVHVGELTAEAGTTDLLDGVNRWAVANPERLVQLAWAGDGCMRGVLEAQPLQPNVEQVFHCGEVSRAEYAALFLRSDLMVTAAAPCAWTSGVLEAMATGLPVLGSAASLTVQQLVIDDESGWLFEPHVTGSFGAALHRALNAPRDKWDAVGAKAASRAQLVAFGTLDARIGNALRSRRILGGKIAARAGFAG